MGSPFFSVGSLLEGQQGYKIIARDKHTAHQVLPSAKPCVKSPIKPPKLMRSKFRYPGKPLSSFEHDPQGPLFMDNFNDNEFNYGCFLFQWVFASIIASIVIGSIIERTQFVVQNIMSSVLMGVVYLVIVH